MKRSIHFLRHGHEFGAVDEFAYEQLADAFMFGPVGNRRQCVRGNRDTLRFEDANRHFGVAASTPEYLKTFYVVPAGKIQNRGGPAGFFQHECGRVM